MTRNHWIDKADRLPVSRQCVLASIARASLYAQQKAKLLVDAGAQYDDL